MKFGNLRLITFIFCLTFLTSVTTFARQINETKSIIHNESELKINGTSNVVDFECNYSQQISTDTLNHSISYGDSLFITGDALVLESSNFDCGRRSINRDMQKTLKVNEYPYLSISLSSIEIADELPFDSQISVTIAGINRIERVEISEFSSTDSSISFKGSGQVLLTNYELKPPSALFGLVKVDDQISISFDLTIEQ